MKKHIAFIALLFGASTLTGAYFKKTGPHLLQINSCQDISVSGSVTSVTGYPFGDMYSDLWQIPDATPYTPCRLRIKRGTTYVVSTYDAFYRITESDLGFETVEVYVENATQIETGDMYYVINPSNGFITWYSGEIEEVSSIAVAWSTDL